MKFVKLPNINSFKDIPDLKSKDLEGLVEELNEFFKYFNYMQKSLSLKNSFNCYIKEVTFQASGDSSGRDSQKIQHFLGVVPKYRIILRQTGNGVLEDTPSGWNTSYITMKNRGSEVVTATIMIVRE